MPRPFRSSILVWAMVATGAFACADTLPSDVKGYRRDDDCQKMNAALLPQRADDPHEGQKDVYACNVELSALQSNTRPFPDGAIIIKESTRKDSDYPWLVATARKRGGTWTWNEYSRNFEDEPFVEILPSEQVCIDCHRKVEALDWIYTPYSRRDSEVDEGAVLPNGAKDAGAR